MFLSRILRTPPPILEANEDSHKAFHVASGVLFRKELRKRLLKLPFLLICAGVGCAILGFDGIIGGSFFNLKLDILLNLEASTASPTVLSSPPSLINRPRLIPFRTLSGMSVEITLSEVRLRVVTGDPFDP